MLRRLLIVAAVLLVLLVVADRGGNYVAESMAAGKLKQSEQLSSRPNVDIAGFPFLTQLASGDFDEITVDAKDVTVGQGSRALDITRLHVVLHGVHVSSGFSRFRADRASATAHVDYAALSRALGVNVTYVGSGRVQAQASVTVLGRTVSGSITARPEVHGTALGFGAAQVQGGAVAAEAARALQRVFAVEIPLGDIPFQVRIDSLTATPNGLELKLSGRDLTYVRH